MFPLDFVQSNWLKQLPFFTSSPQIDLCFFLVLKLEAGVGENSLTPELIPLYNTNIFRVCYNPNENRAFITKSKMEYIKVNFYIN